MQPKSNLNFTNNRTLILVLGSASILLLQFLWDMFGPDIALAIVNKEAVNASYLTSSMYGSIFGYAVAIVGMITSLIFISLSLALSKLKYTVARVIPGIILNLIILGYKTLFIIGLLSDGGSEWSTRDKIYFWVRFITAIVYFVFNMIMITKSTRKQPQYTNYNYNYNYNYMNQPFQQGQPQYTNYNNTNQYNNYSNDNNNYNQNGGNNL
jgi:hypothetical protein